MSFRSSSLLNRTGPRALLPGELREAPTHFSALTRPPTRRNTMHQDAWNPTRVDCASLECIGLIIMSPASSQQRATPPIWPSDVDEKIKALGRDAAEYGFELLLLGTRDRIAQLESDLAACDRNAGQREAAFRSTSATWDTMRVAMETELGAYRTAVRKALRLIERHAGSTIADVRNLLRVVHRS